jgi:putative hydrolase of the HAD superfamily
VFDLDNTLYPADSTIYDDIGHRMTAYIARALDIDAMDALDLRERYYHAYGATVVGLMTHHGVSGADFMADVHDVTVHDVGPNEALNTLIRALPGRRIVFTNGARDYAHRIVALIGLADAFERIVSLEDVGFSPKPNDAAFAKMFDLCEIDPHRAVMFEDHPKNLATAARLGMGTVLVGPQAQDQGADFGLCAPNLETALKAMRPPH